MTDDEVAAPREFRPDLLRHRHPFDAAGLVLERPHPGLPALDRELAGFEQPVLHVEARAAKFGHAGFDHEVVAEARRDEKSRADVDQRKSGEPLAVDQRELGDAERALEQRAGRIVEDREIAWEEHDSHRIAVAPLDADVAGIDQHRPILATEMSWPAYAGHPVSAFACRKVSDLQSCILWILGRPDKPGDATPTGFSPWGPAPPAVEPDHLAV